MYPRFPPHSACFPVSCLRADRYLRTFVHCYCTKIANQTSRQEPRPGAELRHRGNPPPTFGPYIGATALSLNISKSCIFARVQPFCNQPHTQNTKDIQQCQRSAAPNQKRKPVDVGATSTKSTRTSTSLATSTNTSGKRPTKTCLVLASTIAQSVRSGLIKRTICRSMCGVRRIRKGRLGVGRR